MSHPPVLRTSRLTLRPHRAEDFDAYFALISNRENMRFISGSEMTREQAWARMLRYPGMWSLLGFGPWALEDAATGIVIGEAGFLESKRDLMPSIEGTLEMGWLLAPGFHGKGLATEAVSAAITWGEANFPDRPMTCIIDPDNLASLRVAAKFGFVEKARTTYRTADIIVLERAGRTTRR